MRTGVLFITLFGLAVSAGCQMMEQHRSPEVITTAPPYWQSPNQLAQSQMAEMRVFHEKEAALMSEEMLLFRNHEIERLEAASKGLEKSRPRQSVAEMPPPRDKWNPFRRQTKERTSETPAISSRLGESSIVR